MNFVRSAGNAPAGPFPIVFESRRAGIFACAGVLAALNAQAAQILAAINYANSLTAVSNLAGISAVVWFAMYAAIKVGFESDPAPLTRTDRCIVIAIVGLSLLPAAVAAKAGLELCALYAVFASRKDQALPRVGVVLLALTGPLIWGRIILDAFANPLLSTDAHLVGAAIGTKVHGNIVQFAGGQRQFLISTGCSSVHNMSLAIVLWATAAALFRVRFDANYVSWGVLTVVFMFALNIIRLSAIGLFPENFRFLHDGLGSELFGWAGLIGAGLIVLGGVRSAVARQR